jgi:drug/metabolite transporter (DMT)-like permease
VLSRPLLRLHPVILVSGVEMLIGGLGLCVLSLLVEDWPAGLVFRFFEPAVLSSWLMLTLGGAVFAFTIYMRLLRDWGPARAGAYAFVTPLVAVLLGGLVYGEPFGASETVGSALMLAAAAVALRAKARDAEGRQRGPM